MRTCTLCKTEKADTEFYRHIRMKSGLSSNCKSCCYIISRRWAIKNKEKMREATRRHRMKYPERRRDYEIKRAYGISSESYERMFREQNGACKICVKQNLDGRRLSIDHDHNTGTVRGLLCVKCNTGIGNFFDDPTLLESAITYLNQYQSKEKL